MNKKIFLWIWIIIGLGLFTMAVLTLKFDGWGLDSIYMHKVMLFLLFGGLIYLQLEIKEIKKSIS